MTDNKLEQPVHEILVKHFCLERANSFCTAEARVELLALFDEALRTARREMAEECAKIAEDEPLPEGPPPQELIDRIYEHGAEGYESLAIAAVEATKKSIAATIRARLAELEEPPCPTT